MTARRESVDRPRGSRPRQTSIPVRVVGPPPSLDVVVSALEVLIENAPDLPDAIESAASRGEQKESAR